MTQGKIERWHRSLKNQVLLENYYLAGELEKRIVHLTPRDLAKRAHPRGIDRQVEMLVAH